MGKLYTVRAYGGYDTGSILLQSRYPSYYYSLDLKRTLLKEKANLTFNDSNFFTPACKFRSSTTDHFISESVSYQYQRTVRLSFSYRFGQLDASGSRQRRSVRNDDSKGGGSTSP